MQEAGGRKLILPPAGPKVLGQPDAGPALQVWAGPGPDGRSFGPKSAQINFLILGRGQPVVFYFLVGLSPTRLFGPAQPGFFFYIIYIIYYNML